MVYVDDMRMSAKVGSLNRRWSHLSADTLEELHEFAQKLGLKKEWYQASKRLEACHYDVTDFMREKALNMGAIGETMEEGSWRRKAIREKSREATL